MTTSGLEADASELFSARRDSVFDGLGDGVMVLPAAPIQLAAGDTERPYAPDRELFYATGVTEPEAVAVLVGGADGRFELFVRERDPGAELWSGPRLGVEVAAERFGADGCHPISELAERLPELLHVGDSVHFRLGAGGAIEEMVLGALERARTRGARTGSGPRAVVDPGRILDVLRVCKDEAEIDLIRRAAAISEEGHRAGAAALGPGVGEWIVEAAVNGAFRAEGARGPAFETIVGSGANGCVLHYVTNSDTIAEDALVLIDAGAEFGLYNGDITRTYPASGRFTETQRAVYDIVDAARAAAIDTVRPGATVADVHEAAARVVSAGLIDLGALGGPVDDVLEEGAYKRFFPHQTSHWLGLTVHDVGDYARNGVSRALEPGMVLTVEPGLYFAPGSTDSAAEALEGIGIRIEDDVLVTADGNDVLTASLPTAAEEIEALVRAPR